ncbi:MAG: hypothetical protein ABIR62_07380 [Dokdonella sp.]|uniref:hypothetical protein n=1 Tax=Dokdonella sp. TaxID=2291710 RepID=UPI0032671966
MKAWLAAVAAAALPLHCIAQAVQTGTLELRWGDPPPGSGAAPRFEARITDADGHVQAIDAQQALRASQDLFSLYGREVDVIAQPGLRTGDTLVPESIMASGVSVQATQMPRVLGSQPWVTLLCKFADITDEPRDIPYFTGTLSNDPGRLDQYWRDVSYDKVDIVGSEVHGWYTLPHPRVHYVPLNADGSDGRADLDALWNDCTHVADVSVDFTPFVGINTMYNANLDCCAWGGGHRATLDGVNKIWYSTWEPPWGYANEAPLAHEMGHGFGLPHANNSDRDSDPYDNPWDVMSDAWDHAGGDSTFGAQPKHIGIWSRDHLGWIDSARKVTISDDGSVTGIVLDRASLIGSTNPQMIEVTLPAPEPASHYYVIEARKRVSGFEVNLAGDAVIIHEVSLGRSEPAWSVDASVPPANVADDPGSMFVVGEQWTEPGGAFTVHVTAQTAEGFVLDVQRGPGDVIFASGFD